MAAMIFSKSRRALMLHEGPETGATSSFYPDARDERGSVYIPVCPPSRTTTVARGDWMFWINALSAYAHLFAKRPRSLCAFSFRNTTKREPGLAPDSTCMLLSTPEGLGMGTGPERQKHREGWMEDGGGRTEEEEGEPTQESCNGWKIKKGLFQIHLSRECLCLTVG